MDDRAYCDHCKKELTAGMNYWWFGDYLYCDECYEKVKDDD